MSKKRSSVSSNKSSVDTTARYGLVGTIIASVIAVIGTITAAYISYLGVKEQINAPLIYTQTAEASQNMISGSTEFPTSNVVNETVPTNYLAFEDFKNNCINLMYWSPFAYQLTPDIFSSSITANPILTNQTEDCFLSNQDFNWGFEVNNGSLIIRNKLREGQISTFYAISTPIMDSSVITFEVLVSELDGNLVIGVQSDPTSLLMESDVSRTYLDITFDQKITLRRGFVTNIGTQSFTKGFLHQIKMTVSPDYVLVDIDKWQETISIDGDFESPHFVIGYTISGGDNLEVTFSNFLLSNK